MLSYGKLPIFLAGDALHTKDYPQNRSPTKAIPTNSTPWELWYSRQTNLFYFKSFRCKADVLISKEQSKQLDSHSHETIFSSYSEEVRAYCLITIQT